LGKTKQDCFIFFKLISMEVFIVRPFGNRPVLQKDKVTGKMKQVLFDFDKTEKELIAPALKALHLKGGTTGAIWASGSIHEDMFSLLLLADIVIADITIHNANVFYELGIRHSLRDRMTILLKCPGYADTPFDIAGYKYLEYDITDPGKTLNDLVKTIEETIRFNRPDSPVFGMLPKLESQGPEKFLALPADFREEVRIAIETKQAGKLSLLATEAETYVWEIPALRIIGEGLYKMKAMEAARVVWEKVKNKYRNDLQANDRLATIYQRLAEKEMGQNPVEGAALLSLSDIAIETLLSRDENLDKDKRAEAWALKARNTKTRWIDNWKETPHQEKSVSALESGYQEVAFKQYERAYFENLNHYYSGINALGLINIIITLAEAHPPVWELRYNTGKKAEQVLEAYKEKRESLEASVRVSIEAEYRRQEENGGADIWLEITQADYACLTETRPARVAAMYKKALEGAHNFHYEAARRQLEIYEQLNVLPENVKAALEVIPDPKKEKEQGTHYFLFTGHMIDKADRTEPRFPAAKEEAVKKKIKEILEEEKKKTTDKLKGIAGGACGGDILFHEICAELDIKTEIYLALPREQFLVSSVQFAGVNWVERFDKLYKKLPHQVLSPTKELPAWLSKKENYGLWERNNLWELNAALVDGGINMTLIALWDGKGADGPGGTEDMVKLASEKGAKVIVIDMKTV
jgi:hypothetical protein